MKHLRVAALVVAMVAVNANAWALFGIPLPPLVVFDPLVFGENLILNKVAEVTHDTSKLIDDQLRRMARRMWIFVDAGKYRLSGQPLWRTRHGDDIVAPAAAFMYSVNGWSPADQIDQAMEPRLDPAGVEIGRDLYEQLATLDILDGSLRGNVDQHGKVRVSRRDWERTIAELEKDTLDWNDSLTKQSDVMAAGELIGVKKRMERAQMLSGLNEMMLAETKRDRDAEATGVRMQTQTEKIDVLDGSTESLSGWRMP